jgi:hypothetical protein
MTIFLVLSGLPASVNEMVAVASRLVATSSVSLLWCRNKTHQYLASMAVGNFLLISQTDLKVIQMILLKMKN